MTTILITKKIAEAIADLVLQEDTEKKENLISDLLGHDRSGISWFGEWLFEQKITNIDVVANFADEPTREEIVEEFSDWIVLPDEMYNELVKETAKLFDESTYERIHTAEKISETMSALGKKSGAMRKGNSEAMRELARKRWGK